MRFGIPWSRSRPLSGPGSKESAFAVIDDVVVLAHTVDLINLARALAWEANFMREVASGDEESLAVLVLTSRVAATASVPASRIRHALTVLIVVHVAAVIGTCDP